MAEATALLMQVDSDLHAGDRVYDPADARTYCQAIAKYQQAVEKSIKAIIAALTDNGVLSIGTGFSHDPEKLISVLVRLPHAKEHRDIQNEINYRLDEHRRGEIRALCALAPKRPEPGQPRQRNTEYPFHRADGTWCAPAEAGVFTPGDVQRFKRLAEELYPGVHKIVTVIRLGAI